MNLKPFTKEIENKVLIEWCADELFIGMKENSEEIKNYSKERELELKASLAMKMFQEALTETINFDVEDGKDFAKEILNSDSLEETLLKASLYSQKEPDFNYKLNLKFLTSYFKICLEYKITPNIDLLAFYKFLLEN